MDHVDLDHLRPADPAEVEAALAFALIHATGGRRRTTNAAELMARIVADELVDALDRAGFTLMQKPPDRGGSALGFGFRQTPEGGAR